MTDFSGRSWLSCRCKWATVSAPLKYWCTAALVVDPEEELAVPLLSTFMLYEKLISPALANKLKYSHLEKKGSYINVLVIVHLWCTILRFTSYFWILTSTWTISLSARNSILDLSKFQNSCFFKRHHQPRFTFSSSASHTQNIPRNYTAVWLRAVWAESGFVAALGSRNLWNCVSSNAGQEVSKATTWRLCLQKYFGPSRWLPSETCIAAFPIARDG